MAAPNGHNPFSARLDGHGVGTKWAQSEHKSKTPTKKWAFTDGEDRSLVGYASNVLSHAHHGCAAAALGAVRFVAVLHTPQVLGQRLATRLSR